VLEAQARVVAVEPGYVWVESERRSACGQCDSGGSCGVSTLGKLFGGRSVHLRVADPLGVRAGDDVVIGLSERGLVAAALAAYLLPLAAMLAAALLGARLGYGQLAQAVLSVAGLVAGLWLARLRGRGTTGAGAVRPVLLRRQCDEECVIQFKPAVKGVHHD
jgi:sigma-E factor negative regulatory protein RseC